METKVKVNPKLPFSTKISTNRSSIVINRNISSQTHDIVDRESATRSVPTFQKSHAPVTNITETSSVPEKMITFAEMTKKKDSTSTYFSFESPEGLNIRDNPFEYSVNEIVSTIYKNMRELHNAFCKGELKKNSNYSSFIEPFEKTLKTHTLRHQLIMEMLKKVITIPNTSDSKFIRKLLVYFSHYVISILMIENFDQCRNLNRSATNCFDNYNHTRSQFIEKYTEINKEISRINKLEEELNGIFNEVEDCESRITSCVSALKITRESKKNLEKTMSRKEESKVTKNERDTLKEYIDSIETLELNIKFAKVDRESLLNKIENFKNETKLDYYRNNLSEMKNDVICARRYIFPIEDNTITTVVFDKKHKLTHMCITYVFNVSEKMLNHFNEKWWIPEIDSGISHIIGRF